jgi:hypothetical protein
VQARDGAKMELYCAHAGIFSVLRGGGRRGACKIMEVLGFELLQDLHMLVADHKWISSSNRQVRGMGHVG